MVDQCFVPGYKPYPLHKAADNLQGGIDLIFKFIFKWLY